MKFEVWLDSGANIQSTRKVTVDLDKDLGISEDEWNHMTEKEQEELMQGIAFERLDWGYRQL